MSDMSDDTRSKTGDEHASRFAKLQGTPGKALDETEDNTEMAWTQADDVNPPDERPSEVEAASEETLTAEVVSESEGVSTLDSMEDDDDDHDDEEDVQWEEEEEASERPDDDLDDPFAQPEGHMAANDESPMPQMMVGGHQGERVLPGVSAFVEAVNDPDGNASPAAADNTVGGYDSTETSEHEQEAAPQEESPSVRSRQPDGGYGAGLAGALGALLATPFTLPAKLTQGARRQFVNWRGARAKKAAWELATGLESEAFRMRRIVEQAFSHPEIMEVRDAIAQERDPAKQALLKADLEGKLYRYRNERGVPFYESVDRSLSELERMTRALEKTVREHSDRIDAGLVSNAMRKSLLDVDATLARMEQSDLDSMKKFQERMEQMRQSIDRMLKRLMTLLNRLIGGMGGTVRHGSVMLKP